jgi:adenine-specific DNA-methyltransferase
MDFSPDWEFIHMKTLNESAWTRKMSHSDEFTCLISENEEEFVTSLSGPTLGELCTIQNGVATNCDRVYVRHWWAPRGDFLRPAIKASTLNQDCVIIFPYQWTGTNYIPLSEEQLKELEPDLYYTLLFNRDQLDKRNMEKNAQWFQYARSQGIQHSNHRKFVLKHILRNDQEFAEFVEVGPETIVYSGMYIVVNDDANIDRVRKALSSREFCKFLLIFGKDMAGGYKNVSTSIVKKFPIGNEHKE